MKELSVFENGQLIFWKKNLQKILQKNLFSKTQNRFWGRKQNFFGKIKCPLNCPTVRFVVFVFHITFTITSRTPPSHHGILRFLKFYMLSLEHISKKNSKGGENAEHKIKNSHRPSSKRKTVCSELQ